MAGLSTVATIAGLVGSAVSAVGTIASGRAKAEAIERQAEAEQEAAEFEAKQLDIKAKEERAAAQRDMLEFRRQKQLALSRLVNVAAGSGFTATDPTALNLAGDIESFGTLQEQSALATGESRARGLEGSAEGLRFSGRSGIAAGAAQARAARTGSILSAGGTILGGISTMADRYARRPFQPTSNQFDYWYQ